MNSIDFTLGVFLTKEEYDLLDWMCNCDSYGNPFNRNEDKFPCPYSPLDHIATAEIALRKYLREGNIDHTYNKNLFKDNPFGYNKIEVIKRVNRIIFKVFYNCPLYLGVVNMGKVYKISDGFDDEPNNMVEISFNTKEGSYLYGFSRIYGSVEFNDRIQELFDVRWGGLVLRNVEYDDMIVYGVGSRFNPKENSVAQGLSLVNKIIAHKEGKLSEGSVEWVLKAPGVGIYEHDADEGIVGQVFNAVVDGNREAIMGGNLTVEEDDDFFDDVAEVREVTIAGDMPF